MATRAVLVAALAAALLAGCGSSSKSSSTSTTKTDATATFKSGYQPLVNQLKNTTIAVGHAVQTAKSKTDAQLAAKFKSLGGQWQNELSRLETLQPPPRMAVNFNTLKGAATRVESDLTAITSAAATHQAQPARQATVSLINDALATKDAAGKLNQQLGIK